MGRLNRLDGDLMTCIRCQNTIRLVRKTPTEALYLPDGCGWVSVGRVGGEAHLCKECDHHDRELAAAESR